MCELTGRLLRQFPMDNNVARTYLNVFDRLSSSTPCFKSDKALTTSYTKYQIIPFPVLDYARICSVAPFFYEIKLSRS